MPRLSRSHQLARSQVSDLVTSRLPLEALAERVARILETAIGWDGYRIFQIDPGTHFVNRLLASSDNDAAARLEWLRDVYLTMPIPYAELSELARSGVRSVALQERQDQCWGIDAGQRSRLDPAAHFRTYHEYESPLGGAMLSVFRADGMPIAAMQVYRRDPGRPFRSGDVAFMQQVNGLVGQVLATGMANAARLHAVAAPEGIDVPGDGSGVLLVERDGTIRYASPLGLRWLDGMTEAEGMLPTAIWSALAALGDGTGSGHPASFGVRVPVGRGTVRVEASPAGEDGVAAVVITPERPTPTIEIPAAWTLTRQEGQIVRLLATGGTNRELADRLHIGEHTVEWHLRRVYDKAGVRSRQQLVAALFQHSHLPRFDALPAAS